MDDEGTSEARRIKIENIEEEEPGEGNRVGTSIMPCYPPASSSSSMSEVVNHSNDEDKIVKKRRKIDGNSDRNKLAVATGGVDPEPCHHGWVGALGTMRGASAPAWVCTKNLTHTDLDPSQSRLLLLKADVEKFVGEFLTERERSQLSRCGGGSGSGSRGVAAVMVDEMGRCWETRLNLWASKSYNLNGSSWRRMVSRYELSEQYAVKVGAFRYYASASHQGEEEKSLGFVLLVQRKI